MDLSATYVAIHSYSPSATENSIASAGGPALLPLWIGEHLRIVAHNENWCYGHYRSDPARSGLFPRANVHPLRETRDGASLESQQLIAEITGTVKVWWHHAKQRFRHNLADADGTNQHLKAIEDMMVIRNKLQASNIPISELKDMRLAIAKKIDFGNVSLGLELQIRDEFGKTIPMNRLSVASAYCHHEEAQKALTTKADKNAVIEKCSILFNVDPIPELKSSEDVTIAIYLANDKTGEVETETLTLNWLAAEKRFRHSSCRGLFVDLMTRELRESILRVVVVLSRQSSRRVTSGKDAKRSPSSPVDVCVPCAFGSVQISDRNCNFQGKDKREILVNITRINNNSSNTANASGSTNGAATKSFPLLFGTRPAVNTSETSSTIDYKIPLNLSVQALPGCLEEIQSRYANIFLSTNPPPPALLQRIRPADGNQIIDFWRNEVYVRLKFAELRVGKLAPSTAAAALGNYEAILSVWDANGKQLPNCFEVIMSDTTEHTSSIITRIRSRDERLHFDETFKILLPETLSRSLHLRILFYYRRSSHKDDHKHRSGHADGTPIALSYLPIIENFVLVSDEAVELNVYKIETSKLDERNISYLKLASKRTVVTACGTISAPIITAYGSFALVEKALVAVGHSAVSALYTKSTRLFEVLNWKKTETISDNMISHRIKNLLDMVDSSWSKNENDMRELFQFLPSLLDALFELSAKKILSHSSQAIIFDAIVQLIRLCHEPKNKQFKDVLEDYIQKFSSANAHVFIIKNLIRCLEDDNNINIAAQNKEPRDRVLSVLKVLETQTKLIVMSKRAECFVADCVNGPKSQSGSSQFTERMNHILELIAQLTRFTSPTRVTVQNAAVKYFPAMIAPLLQHGVYEPLTLAKFVADLVNNLSDTVILHQRLTLLSEMVATELFYYCDCRRLLMPTFIDQLLRFISPELLISKNHPKHKQMGNGSERILKRQGTLATLPSGSGGSVPPAGSVDTEALKLVELAARIFVDLLEKLFPFSHARETRFEYGTPGELYLLISRVFRPVNQTLIVMLGEQMQCQSLHMLLLTVLDKFSAENFIQYFNNLPTSINRLDECSEMLHMFRDVLRHWRLPASWHQMRRIQQRLLARATQYVSAVIIRQFRDHENRTVAAIAAGDVQLRAPPARTVADTTIILQPPSTTCELAMIPEIWLECVLTLVAIAKSLDEDSNNNGIHAAAKSTVDAEELLRSQVAATLRSLWFSLQSSQKLKLIRIIMGPILEMALREEESSFREIIIPIFYDMLETENYHVIMALNRSARQFVNDQNSFTNCAATVTSSSVAAIDVDSNDSCRMFTDEFIAQLDPLLDENQGGALFRRDFIDIFSQRSLTRPTLNMPAASGGIGELDVRQFIAKVDKLLELLLNYRQVRLNSDCIENGMYCTVQLIDFYQQIEQNALYVNYLYKLYDLHVLSGNFVEAALTLRKHANLLKWSDDLLEDYLVVRPQHKLFSSHAKLKKHIYAEMVNLFDRGEHWEKAVDVLKELIVVYENQIYDFDELAQLLRLLAELYTKVASTIRMEHNYFIVAFYGRDIPSYLRGKRFVFRGEKLEQWSSFKQRMLHNYHGLKFVETMDLNVAELADSDGKFIQIIPIIPQPSATYSLLSKSPSRLARWYYKHHDVQRFELLRRENRPNSKWTSIDDNDATRLWIQRIYMTTKKPLPDILKFTEIAGDIESELADPVQVAVMKVEEVNEQLVEAAQLVASGFIQFLVNLGGKIRGVLQADVGGGIRNYDAFFTNICWNNASESERKTIHELKSLLREHITILEYALYVHSSKRANINESFHNSLVDIFATYRKNVETRFGAARSVLPTGASIQLTEQNLQKQESALATVKDDFEWSSSEKQNLHAAASAQNNMSAMSAKSKSSVDCRISNGRINSISGGSPLHKTSANSTVQSPTTIPISPFGDASRHADMASFRQNSIVSALGVNSPNVPKRHGLRSLGRMMSVSTGTKSSATGGFSPLVGQERDESRTMILALQQLSAKRISANSALSFAAPDDTRHSTVSDSSLLIDDDATKAQKALPPRTSSFHSHELIRGN